MAGFSPVALLFVVVAPLIISALISPCPKCTGTHLVNNGDFSNGMTNWSQHLQTFYQAHVHIWHDNPTMHLHGYCNHRPSTGGIKQTLETAKGVMYILTFKFWSGNYRMNPDHDGLKACMGEKCHEFRATADQELDHPGSPWRRHEHATGKMTYVAASSNTTLSFWSGPNECVDIDDVEVRSMPDAVAVEVRSSSDMTTSHDPFTAVSTLAGNANQASMDKESQEDRAPLDGKLQTKSDGFMMAIAVLTVLANEAADSDATTQNHTEGMWKAIDTLRKVEGSCIRGNFEFEEHEEDQDEDDDKHVPFSRSSRRSGPGGGASRSSGKECPAWASGTGILEADKIIKGNKVTLAKLVLERCPSLTVSEPDGNGKNHYARVKFDLSQEKEVRECIKAIAKEKGKRSNIKVIHMFFDGNNSPRW